MRVQKSNDKTIQLETIEQLETLMSAWLSKGIATREQRSSNLTI